MSLKQQAQSPHIYGNFMFVQGVDSEDRSKAHDQGDNEKCKEYAGIIDMDTDIFLRSAKVLRPGVGDKPWSGNDGRVPAVAVAVLGRAVLEV